MAPSKIDGVVQSLGESPSPETAMTTRTASTRRTTTGKPKARRSKAEQRAESQDLILNGAEQLFSRRGLHGVTIKDVAKEVGVDAALIHYYFADKKALFDAVLERRAPVTSGRRMDAMDAYEASVGDKVTLEGALHAYLDTDLDSYIQGGEAWRSYGQIGALIAHTPEWGSELLNRLMDPVVMRLIGLLRKAMPDAPDEDIFWGYQFVSGALMMTLARTGRIDKLSGGLCHSDDFEAVKERMATFMAGGFRAICEQRRVEREAARDG
jgi:AcrR family transcriptional regulator